jgi:molybdate transport system substrate-binding protein
MGLPMSLSRRLLRLTLSLSAILLPASAMPAASVLQVAAAADLATCINELSRRFEENVGGTEVRTSIGSSGNLFAQIKNGAPFDVFLSADTYYPRELGKAGLADAASLKVYAHGHLKLWTNDPAVNVDRGFRLLTDPDVTRIAIANPDVAPYGRAAREALMRYGIWEEIRHKLVFGENVAQTAQFVETRNAQVGIVSGTLLSLSNGTVKGQAWTVPADFHSVIEQGAIVTMKGKANPASYKYIDFVRSHAGQAILRKYGFSLPMVQQ